MRTSRIGADTQPKIVERATATLPQGTSAAIFTVSGRVIVTQIVGEVTTEIQGQETVIKLIANPTVGASVDICAALETNADAVGTLYNITGTLADAMIATTSGAMIAQASAVIVAAGTIDLDTDNDSSTGAIKWTIHFLPLDKNSNIVIA